MPQITIHLDEDTFAHIVAYSQAEAISSEACVIQAIKERFGQKSTNANPQWSHEVRDLVGTWMDVPTVDEIRQTQATDVVRELL